MFVGHALLAFALVAVVAVAYGKSEERALTLGVVAGGFALVPDVDMAYALVGLIQSGIALSAGGTGGAAASVTEGVWTMTGAFWETSHLIHRAVTHSLVLSVPAAVAFSWCDCGRLRRFAAGLLLAAVVGVTFTVSGPLGAAVAALFALAGAGLALVSSRRTTLTPRELFVAALVGLLSHPFGDLFTGSPPRFFYPLDATLVDGRVALVGDPTLNLLTVFGLELATIWVAVAVYGWLTSEGVRTHVDTRAVLGAGYAVAALVLPAPTLDVSYHFVFSILAVGAIGVAPRSRSVRPIRSIDAADALAVVVTGLAAITIAAVTYAAAYHFV